MLMRLPRRKELAARIPMLRSRSTAASRGIGPWIRLSQLAQSRCGCKHYAIARCKELLEIGPFSLSLREDGR